MAQYKSKSSKTINIATNFDSNRYSNLKLASQFIHRLNENEGRQVRSNERQTISKNKIQALKNVYIQPGKTKSRSIGKKSNQSEKEKQNVQMCQNNFL